MPDTTDDYQNDASYDTDNEASSGGRDTTGDSSDSGGWLSSVFGTLTTVWGAYSAEEKAKANAKDQTAAKDRENQKSTTKPTMQVSSYLGIAGAAVILLLVIKVIMKK